jgi:hypothetical protein
VTEEEFKEAHDLVTRAFHEHGHPFTLHVDGALCDSLPIARLEVPWLAVYRVNKITEFKSLST